MAKVPGSSWTKLVRHHGAFEFDDEFEEIFGILATPLIQVFSVRISTDLDDGPCEIYGSIRALEGPYPRFNLYERNLDDSETLWKDGTLSLCGPVSGAIVPSLNTTLDICLKDRIRGVEVVNGVLNLDPMTEDSYDRLIKGVVEGAHGSAHVYYTVFKFALYGTLQVIIYTDDNVDNKTNNSNIYGSVVAGYENGRRYCRADDEVKCLEIQLFDKPPDRPFGILVGTPVTFSRNVIVVPAYSTLKIQLNLWDSNSKIADDLLLFSAHFSRPNPYYIETEHACVSVNVRWSTDAYLHIYRERKVDNFQVANSSKVEDVQKNSRVLCDQKFSESLVPRAIPSTKCSFLYHGYFRAEVFTVYVDGINEKISALCGTIIIDDGSGEFSIYKRDESCFETLPDHSLACIEFNYRAIRNSEFYIILNLRDPISKLEVSNGYVCWNVCHLSMKNMSWENKQLCSVVRGRNGYAAVHYAIFNNAFAASVEVKLFRDARPDIPIKLYGTLVAGYNNYDYSTSYQQKYYKSRLLDWPQDRFVELESGSKIAMLKSKVAVPVGSSLMIEADFVALGTDNAYEAIFGIVEFKIDLCGTISKEIRGQHHWMQLSVTF